MSKFRYRVSIKALRIFLMLAIPLNADAQIDFGLHPDIKGLLSEADSCIKSRLQNCTEKYQHVLRQARKNYPKADYWDYLYYKTARAYYLTGIIDSIEIYCDSALQAAQMLDTERILPEIYNVRGTYYFSKGKGDKAIADFIEAAKGLEDRGDTIYAAYTYSNVGLSLGEINDIQGSIRYLNKAVQLLLEHPEDVNLPTIAANLGLAYAHSGDKTQAEEWANWTLDHSDQSLEQSAHAIAHFTLALLYSDSDPDISIKQIHLALKLADSTVLKPIIIGEIHQAHSEILFKLGKYNEALQAALRAEVIFDKIGFQPGLHKIYRLAAQAAGKVGEHKLSNEYWKKYAHLSDSIFALETAQQLQELNVRYETEKKEREIAQKALELEKKNHQIRQILISIALFLASLGVLWILYRKNQQLKWKTADQKREIDVFNALIRGEENERNRLAQELHDGAASMVTAAIYQIRAGLRQPGMSKADLEFFHNAASILEKTHSEIRRMAHNLLPVILEEKGLTIALHTYCDEMSSGTGIKIHFEENIGSGKLINSPVQLIIYRIVQELVQNAVKYSKADQIWVKIHKQHQDLQLIIKDDGVGIDQMEDIHSGQGLKQIKERVMLLGGEATFGGKEKPGFVAEITLKKVFED